MRVSHECRCFMNRQWLSFIAILVIAGIIAFVTEDFITEAIILPIFYVFWISQLIYASIPQTIVWSIFIILTLFITWRYTYTTHRSSLKPPMPTQKQVGRIESWRTLIQRAEREPYYKWQLAQQLRKLTFRAIAHNEQLSLSEVRRKFRNDALLDFPDDIQTYLQASVTSFGNQTTNRRGRLTQQKAPTPLDMKPDRITDFLEEKFNL